MPTKEEKAAYNKRWYKANIEKQRSKNKLYYEAHKEELVAGARMYRLVNKEEITRRRHDRNLLLFEYKGSKCSHCHLSEPKHFEIYDYHHIDPTAKLYSMASIMYGPLERLITEADKCILLCSNCHRKEHARLHKENLNEHKE
tara:strand:+ start:1077 stop:1505 length:429 start_codon:yes stop_codon:yes gene_type:complete